MNTLSFPGNVYPSLVPAGRAIYTLDAWKNGNNHGRHYVAQVFAEGDKDLSDTAALLGDSKVLENDVVADRIAELFAASPKMADLLMRIANPEFGNGNEVTEARALLASLGFVSADRQAA